METIHRAAERLMMAGSYPDLAAATAAIHEFAADNDIKVSEDGYISDNDYAEIVHEMI